MKLRITIGLMAILLASCATGKTTVKSKKKIKKSDITLIEAYTQKTLPGIPGALPTTDNHFVIVWNNTLYPATFFWRGENGFLSCNSERAHKIDKKEAGKFPAGIDYITEPAAGDEIHKGDTLLLTPVTRGKFPIPKDIPQNAKNTLYYKTAKSGWLAFPVKTISKKQDIAMP